MMPEDNIAIHITQGLSDTRRSPSVMPGMTDGDSENPILKLSLFQHRFRVRQLIH